VSTPTNAFSGNTGIRSGNSEKKSCAEVVESHIGHFVLMLLGLQLVILFVVLRNGDLSADIMKLSLSQRCSPSSLHTDPGAGESESPGLDLECKDTYEIHTTVVHKRLPLHVFLDRGIENVTYLPSFISWLNDTFQNFSVIPTSLSALSAPHDRSKIAFFMYIPDGTRFGDWEEVRLKIDPILDIGFEVIPVVIIGGKCVDGMQKQAFADTKVGFRVSDGGSLKNTFLELFFRQIAFDPDVLVPHECCRIAFQTFEEAVSPRFSDLLRETASFSQLKRKPPHCKKYTM